MCVCVCVLYNTLIFKQCFHLGLVYLLNGTYIYITITYSNIMTTSMNERTQFFIKIYLSHFILERVDVGYVWEVSWRRGQTVTYWPQFILATIAALLSRLGWAAQPWVAEGPSPLSGAGSHSAGILSPTRTALTVSNWPKPSVAPGYIIVWRPPAFSKRTHLHRIQPRP